MHGYPQFDKKKKRTVLHNISIYIINFFGGYVLEYSNRIGDHDVSTLRLNLHGFFFFFTPSFLATPTHHNRTKPDIK